MKLKWEKSKEEEFTSSFEDLFLLTVFQSKATELWSWEITSDKLGVMISSIKPYFANSNLAKADCKRMLQLVYDGHLVDSCSELRQLD